MATTQIRTKVLETVATKSLTAKKLVEKIGAPLGSPINGKNEGDSFTATLTGNIEIRDFQGTKGAYFTTKEGYSIRVNASFDPATHKEGASMNCICRVFDAPDGRKVKFTAFAD